MDIHQQGSQLPAMDLSEDEDDGEELDWEEVEVQDELDLSADTDEDPNQKAINIVLSKSGDNQAQRKKNPNSAAERRIRHETHRAHTLTLLAAGRFRNLLLNDRLLQARLLSMVPLSLVNAFTSFSPDTHPLVRDRSRLFDSAMKDLISWWWQSFEIIESLDGMRLRTWAEAETLFTAPSKQTNPEKGKGKAKAQGIEAEDPFETLLEMGEPVHGSKSLMKRAVLMRGSRDMSAQLFTSLLRALQLPARLVFSLQPVTWRGAGAGGRSTKTETFKNDSADELSGAANISSVTASKGVKKSKEPKALSVASQASKKKPKRGEWAAKAAKAAQAIRLKSVIRSSPQSHPLSGDGIHTDDDEPLTARTLSYKGNLEDSEAAGSSTADSNQRNNWRSNPAGKASTITPVIKLRKARPVKPKHWTKSPSPEPAQLNRPPVFWTEVYSRPLKEWYCVDVTRKRMRCKNMMEPTKTNPENRMLYVIAFEEDHFIRDVTARYTHSFGATTLKARLPSKKGSPDWFEHATAILKRPYTLRRDEKEDEEILKAQTTESLPTTVGGFKDHPNFALERHLRREEVIHPRKPIGTFRGEPVYARSSVVICKSAETYMREGKRIKGGQEPMKLVKPRTVTINRKREEELMKMDGQEVALQGLFAGWQTELLIPPPIIDGIIPRNGYGNFDLFAAHMLPQGAKHLPYKGIAKTAKQLQVSYADAVVSFEFHKRRAAPVIQGIIVPELEAEFVLDAYFASEDIAQEKEFTKLQERCLKRWKKLILGLRIKRRLQEEYRQSLATANGNAPRDGPSQLKDIGLQPEETGPISIKIDVPRIDETVRPSEATNAYELYTDHRVNTMAMPGPSKPSYVNGHKRQRSESIESEEKEEEVLPAAPTRTRRARKSRRGSDEGAVQVSVKALPPTVAVDETKEAHTEPKLDHVLSSPLSSPPVSFTEVDDPTKHAGRGPRRSGRQATLKQKIEVIEVTKAIEDTPQRKPSRTAPLRSTQKVQAISSPSDRKLRPRK